MKAKKDKHPANLALQQALLGKKSPEEFIIEGVKQLQKNCLAQQTYIRVQSFKDAPGQHAAVVAFITCPDEIADDLHETINAGAQEVFAKHGMGPAEGPDKT